ncbi:MAG: type I-E CRISPR-associated protein Cas7/Cse4/CasC [Lentisphaerae bacterium]|nr:type I-E CRISPR-associated protein Cas7/Cse4/CasC [Lentisphaerota bacterium]
MKLIELHILQSFPVTCLNRDDVNSPKTAVFGGTQRARVSSQSWKRAIRLMAKENQPSLFAGQRTKLIVKAMKEILKSRGKTEDSANKITGLIAGSLGGLDDSEKVKTLLYLSPEQISKIVDKVLAIKNLDDLLKDEKKGKKDKDNVPKEMKDVLKSLKDSVRDASDISFFGRMVADDPELMLEGAGLFSHALSTHKVSNEIDFFTAVDDLKPLDEGGAGHMGTLEFSSACYYRYVGLNLDLLKDKYHLGHLAPEDMATVLKTFIQSSILAVPGARKNSMFGFTPPSCVLGIRKIGQPLSLVNAFEKPVAAYKDSGFVEQSCKLMKEHYGKLTKTYNLTSETELWIPDVDMKSFIEGLIKNA